SSPNLDISQNITLSSHSYSFFSASHLIPSLSLTWVHIAYAVAKVAKFGFGFLVSVLIFGLEKKSFSPMSTIKGERYQRCSQDAETMCTYVIECPELIGMLSIGLM